MRGDSFYCLSMWNDDDVEQLAVQFLANEREHSAQLEAAIERHLEQLRLEVASWRFFTLPPSFTIILSLQSEIAPVYIYMSVVDLVFTLF